MHDDGEVREIRFPDPDEPYLFAAALAKRLGDGALTRAWVVPSGDGPTVLLSKSLLDDSDVRALMEMLEGAVAEHPKPDGRRERQPGPPSERETSVQP